MEGLDANNAMHADSAPTLRFHIGDRWRGAVDGERYRVCMNTIAVLLLLVSWLRVYAADSGVTNLVVTPLEVDAKSVSLTATETRQPNLTFNYLTKTPEQVRAVYRRHQPVFVVKDGVVVAKAIGCTGYKGRRAPDGQMVFSGLVLGFDDLDQARIAEKVLKREDKEPE